MSRYVKVVKEGSRLRVVPYPDNRQPYSGYVQFPNDLRIVGAIYKVDNLSWNGRNWTVQGNINDHFIPKSSFVYKPLPLPKVKKQWNIVISFTSKSDVVNFLNYHRKSSLENITSLFINPDDVYKISLSYKSFSKDCKVLNDLNDFVLDECSYDANINIF